MSDADWPPQQILVDIDGHPDTWTIQSAPSPAGPGWTVVVTASDDRTWSAESSDAFECLRKLRLQLEPEGVRLCCNGARTNAWASGMARDMGGGTLVYLLTLHQAATGDDLVETFDPAPIAEIAPTVDAQDDFYGTWLDSIR